MLSADQQRLYLRVFQGGQVLFRQCQEEQTVAVRLGKEGPLAGRILFFLGGRRFLPVAAKGADAKDIAQTADAAEPASDQ